MAKKVTKTKKKSKRVAWSKALHAELRRHSKAKTPVRQIAEEMGRTVAAVRQRAIKLGIRLGHRR